MLVVVEGKGNLGQILWNKELQVNTKNQMNMQLTVTQSAMT